VIGKLAPRGVGDGVGLALVKDVMFIVRRDEGEIRWQGILGEGDGEFGFVEGIAELVGAEKDFGGVGGEEGG